ncbi:myc box-dependent-interacting protein 1 isoform X2 [Plutella xylostella]|uniref:myc box-dependent-interacting protein 1 isoform X2 n=1 Tax=Plutella xylostella TaxID=51655 RepID=UPI0020325CFF|nr:myc box-dependent-interacting protein 1 isoform X2 [Plutella xylostella]
MAESKGALIAKSMQKHAGRAKEKLLQNLGKVDRTLDDIFEEHLQNFNRQHQQATRLQKEFNNYIRCVRAVQTASKTLMEAITEVYESGWSGHDLLYVQAQNMEMLWQDFSHKLGDQVLIPLNTYTNQFPETRKKIEKRGRKLVDYDSQRHSFQNLQANAAKRRDDVKVTKGREQLEEAKRTYEVLNSELHDELPALFDSRVLFYVNNLQTLFSAEQLFHSESSKVFAELEAITDKLAGDCQRGSYKKISNNISPVSSPKTNTLGSVNGNSVASPNNTIQRSPIPPEKHSKQERENNNGEAKEKKETQDKTENEGKDEVYDIPNGATLQGLPPGVLYRVRATYRYTREDSDELSFDVGDTIRVVEYDDPEEQEEGWLMGIKEGTNEKGMFPANFTRPI